MAIQPQQDKSMREIMKGEYVKCSVDPIYFFKKYVYIQGDEGRTLFNLYLFQEKVLHLLHKNERVAILKSRQLGISTLCAGYALWVMLFNKDKSILAVAPDRDKAMEILGKIQFAYDELPSWLLKMAGAEKKENNKTKLVLKNGSKAEAVSGAAKSARSKSADVVILDEAAFIERATELWASVQQTLSRKDARAIVLSTPNGFDGFFHPLFLDAEDQTNKFIPVRLPWNVHPKRNQKWRDDQDAELGKRMALQECECNFLTSGTGYFDNEDLEFYRNRLQDPVEMRGPKRDYWIWLYPHEVSDCVVVVDTGRGDGLDSSTIQVIEVESGDQVAEYQGDANPSELAILSVQVALEYNGAILVAENNGIGNTTVTEINNIGYTNIYYSPKGDTMDVSKYINVSYDSTEGTIAGFTTSTKTRPNILSKLDEYVRSRSIKIKSRRLHAEMHTFIWKNGKAQAMSGRHDDLILPYAIGLYLRDSALKYRVSNLEMQKSVLLNIRRNDPVSGRSTYNNNARAFVDPYRMNINGSMEDISWVLS
jgi:hypothetical protein